MHILHVDTGREMRGGQWQALFLMEGLAQAGHAGMLMAPEDSPVRLEARARQLPSRTLGLAALWRASRVADIVHTHTGRAHALAALVGVPRLVVSRRVAFPIGRGLASRWKYARAARYVAVSEHVRQKLVEAGVVENRVRVVYDGTPLLDPASLGTRVVAPATDDPRKGAALLRQAAERASVDVHFSNDLVADLRSAAAFVYLTEEEGLGSAVLLAMSAGVPVLASRVGGLVEIVDDGITGMLVANDPAAVADRLQYLLAHRDEAAAMGQRARERVRERFTLEKMVAETIEVYREVLT